VFTSADKGRVLISDCAYNVGDKVHEEKAFVAATWEEEQCICCSESRDLVDANEHSSDDCPVAKEMFKGVNSIAKAERTLSKMEGIDEIDRARLLMKCLVTRREDIEPYMVGLTAANMDRSRAAAKKIMKHKNTKALLRNSYLKGDLEGIAKLISVLNTNSHELDDIGGSGLFVKACICEHSCVPNCSFSTEGDTIIFTCIKPIKKGDALSIDYGNHYYEPTSVRQEHLLGCYEFICKCDMCSGVEPDRCRAFVCPNDNEHMVCAFGGGDTNIFKCLTCSFVADEELANQFKQAEADAINDIPSDLLRAEHHINFELLANQATELTQSGLDPDQACRKWEQVNAFLAKVIPGPHTEKALHYDRLAQACVQAGNIQDAKSAYEKAFNLACECSGQPEISKLSRDMQQLFLDTPQNVEELMERFS